MDLLANIRRLKQIKKETAPAPNQLQTTNNSQKNLIPQYVQSIILPKQQPQREQAQEESIKGSTKQQANQSEMKEETKEIQEQKRQDNKKKQEKAAENIGNVVQSAQVKTEVQVTQRKVRVQQGGLFRGLTFCFPMYNVELSRSRGRAIRITIERMEGIVYEMEDLEQLIEGDDESIDGPIITIDFMLVDARIPRESIEQVIPKEIKYRGIVDFNFIFLCINQDKILNYQHYVVPERSKQLENYLKAKEAEKQQEIENRSKQKAVIFKYAAGIQPIDPQTALKQSNTQIHHIPQSQLQTPKIQEIPKIQHSILKPPQKQKSFNKLIYQSFEKLSELFEKNDRGRALSYSRIAGVLKNVKFDITCEEDAEKLKGLRFVGHKTIQKIKEFIQNGSIQKLTQMEGKQENLVCQKLEKVWGIGKIKAKELYSKGIKSVEDLRILADNDPNALSKNQKIGLKYYEHLNERIPRDKVSRMFEYIKKILFQIVGNETDHKVEVCGSYRRGKETCGDIDVIITRKDGTYETRLISNLVQQLTKQGFLTDHLAMPRHDNPKSCMSYMGICKYEDETHHRVDLKYYPVDQYAFAILYFTGSDVFNRNMRLFAMKSGYCLSDHGMWRAEKIGTNIVVQEPSIPCYTEEEIFQKLGIKYKFPEERSL